MTNATSKAPQGRSSELWRAVGWLLVWASVIWLVSLTVGTMFDRHGAFAV
ncbi:unnamed protein product, partial [marine sediment metagenome]